ncbi:hypothetical protein D6C86_00667 [Aureobasidium pullulans]|nr:hypothetical protein D6C86_00667 [Aureobasidium pullulans]
MVLWASTIHGIPSLPGPKAPHNAPPSTGPIDEPPRLGSQKTSSSRDWNADLTVEDGLFPTSSIWNSPSSTVRSAFQSLDASVSEMRRPKLSVLPLLRAIEEVAWAGAASSEATMITAQKQQLTALRTSIRHPSRMGVDGDADDERSPPPLRRTSGDSSSPSLRERYMEKDQGGLGINLSEVGSFKDNDTTMGLDGDADDERSRESESLRTPISNAFNSLWTPRVKAERERKGFANDLHTEIVERLAYMDNKMDRAIKSDGKFQIQLDNIRESVDAIGVAFIQFGMDDEKVQLIADKVIDALYPIITKGHEQNKADTKRPVDRLTGSHIQFDFQVQNTLAQVCQSVDATGAAFIQFGMDDEKVQLIAEKVVDA